MKYRACCSVCYTTIMLDNVGKRDAERACTSHMNAFGHNTFILPMTRKTHSEMFRDETVVNIPARTKGGR